MRQLCKGNVAVVRGAMLAGCRAYYDRVVDMLSGEQLPRIC